MLTDYHCHVLPGIDDGAEDAEMSIAMLNIMKKQGTERVIATPHFYAHRENSVEDFLKKRQAAFDEIKDKTPIQNIYLGAEVAIEHGISELPNINELAIQGTNLILLELPYRSYEKWMSEEINNISYAYGLTIICAHIHRYVYYYSKAEMRRILKTNAIFQVNHDAFESLKESNFVRSIIRYEYPLVFGSDSHNITTRKPNWDIVRKGRRVKTVEKSNQYFDKFLLQNKKRE